MAENFQEPNYLEYVRDKVHHENDLLNHRMTWMWATHSFLLTAYGALLVVKGKDLMMLAVLICFIGLVTTISVNYSMKIGLEALDELEKFTENVPKEEKILYLGLRKNKWQEKILFP